MQRFVIAFILLGLLVAAAAYVVKSAARAVERSNTSGALTTGDAMQKVSFFLLLCLIAYVSLSGGG